MGQTIKRSEVKGFIYANANDVEAVAIFNKSANKGTITNDQGAFLLEVAVNDIIAISALQFETQQITITEEVVASGVLKIYLVEHVNQLNAVLLRHGLSGNLAVDMAQVESPPRIVMELGNMDALALPDQLSLQEQKVERALNAFTRPGDLYNGVDFVKIAGMLLKPKKRSAVAEVPQVVKPKFLLDFYTRQRIQDTFQIPWDQVDAFIAFVENQGLPQDLLSAGKEFERIDYLVAQSTLFLKRGDDKN